MSLPLLLPADPGTRWTRAAEPWVAGPLSYLPVELLCHGILTENYLASGRSRTAEVVVTRPSPYPLDHEGLVEKTILELPDIF